MIKTALIGFIAILILSTVYPASGAVTIKATVDNSVFVTFAIENLDPGVYNQAITQVNADTIPKAIVSTLQQLDITQVQYSFGPEPLVLNNDTKTIQSSFFLSGSDIVSFDMNQTAMRRAYRVETNWRKFQVSLTSNFTLHFAERLDTPVSDWQRTDATTLYFESKETDAIDMFFYLYLPALAQNVRVDGDTVFYDMPLSLEDQVLNSPLLILAALAVALVIILIYRKIR